MPRSQRGTLQDALDTAKPLYFIPREDVVDEVLVPAFRNATAVDCMMGFFSSHSLAEIAPGLATYLRKSTEPMRLVVSPFLDPSDQEALRLGLHPAEEVASRVLLTTLPDADDLAQHTLACLSWLISQNRLSIRIALMKDALFHTKAWIFRSETDASALHGSSNMTRAGLTRNREQMTLSRSWRGEEATFHIHRLQQEFDELWSGGDDTCQVIDLPHAVREKLLHDLLPGQMPEEHDCHRLWRKVNGLTDETDDPALSAARSFTIPSWLNYQTGSYAHQGRAVDAWKKAEWRGILEMATGSGKTIAAMIGAHMLHTEVGNLFVVISAPYRPLIEQWCSEIEMFGITAHNVITLAGSKARDGRIRELSRNLRKGVSGIEVLLVSNDTLCTEEFINAVRAVSVKKLLIADECHNLGAAGFVTNPPECFDYRLGLSATPIRQYDEEGTDALFTYFGEVCFEFTLEDAIGVCLTPYNYYVHFVRLLPTELDDWQQLTDQIARLSWKFKAGKSDSGLEYLLRQRRLILETAAGKIDVLRGLLDDMATEDLRYTLIYATDKDPHQLGLVNDLLQQKGVLYHQLTYEETADRQATARILASFQAGELKVLTAKRVLDEGVNIPQVEKAFILASTTVRRQWIQRRGRLLRMCKEIGKTHADIHDFVTLPFDGGAGNDADTSRIIKSELDRVWEFAKLCQNGAQPNGPYNAVRHLQGLLEGAP